MLRNGPKLRALDIIRQPNNISTHTKGWNTLGQEFLTMWQQAHGAPQGALNVMVVQGGLIVLIENAFSQAELVLARQSTDNLLHQYIDSLTDQILPLLTARLEQVTHQQVGTTSVTSNIDQNWIMVFLKFDGPASSKREA